MPQATTACEICARLQGERPQEEPPAGYLYEDRHWLVYHAPVERAMLGQLFLLSRRHFLDFAEMTADEATSYGVIMRALLACAPRERRRNTRLGPAHQGPLLLRRPGATVAVVAQLRTLLTVAAGHTLAGDRSVEQRLHLWADELRSIANEGLHWMADNYYEVQRYHRILRIAAAIFATQDVRDVETIERLYHEDLSHFTPYVAGDAAIFDHEYRILLIQRKDNGLWAMPGGDFEVGETPAEGACREA